MENNKQVIIGKDLKILVGLNEKTLEFKFIPYIYNNKKDKFKDLLDNEIFDVKADSDYNAGSILAKKYNVNCYGLIATNTTIRLFKDDDKITENKLNEIIKTANKHFNKIFKKDLKNKEKENLQKIYRDF